MRGGTGTKVLYDLRSCLLTLSRSFFFKIAAAKQQKKSSFQTQIFLNEKPFSRLDESFKRDFLCISIHALKGLCYANDVSRRILLMTSLMTQPFLFCTNRQISRCELFSLSDNNLSNFKKGFKLTFCSKVGLSPLSVVAHLGGFYRPGGLFKDNFTHLKNGKKRPLFAVKNEIGVRYGLMAFFTPLEKDVWCTFWKCNNLFNKLFSNSLGLRLW